MTDFRKTYLYWFYYFIKGYPRHQASYMAYRKAFGLHFHRFNPNTIVPIS